MGHQVGGIEYIGNIRPGKTIEQEECHTQEQQGSDTGGNESGLLGAEQVDGEGSNPAGRWR